MPTFKAATVPDPIEIHNFLGLNQSVGETEIKLGESVVQTNFRLTQDYKPVKRKGHQTFIDFDNALPVQGLWYGSIVGKEVTLSINNGNVYEYDMTSDTETTAIADLITEGVVTLIGTLTDAKTTIFWFNGSLYFLNGTDYKVYDGTTFGDVVGYVPTIAIETPPSGGGTDYEQVNLLTGNKKQEFIGDGTSKDFQLRETDIDSLVSVTIDGVTSSSSFNQTTGIVTFTTAPSVDALVIVEWIKVISGNADLVKNNRFAMDFGPGNDTTMFLWGNENFGNKRMRSGTLDATYFPEFAFTLVGNDQFPITDIVAQYDRQIVYKTNRTFYSYAEYIESTEVYEYPLYDLNERVGNVVERGVILADNSPISIHSQSFWKWSNTQVEDERNATVISERIRYSIEDLDFTTAVTFDHQKEKEMWVNVGSNVYIWNYGNDTFYTYDNIEAVDFIEVQNMVYYSSNGTIERFDDFTDNGVAVKALMELGFTDFGVNHLTKNTRNLWCTIKPYASTSITINYVTNKNNLTETTAVKPISYRLFSYSTIDYSNWTYATNVNVQVFRRKIRAKKYSYIKFIFTNDELYESAAIISFKVMAETQGYAK